MLVLEACFKGLLCLDLDQAHHGTSLPLLSFSAAQARVVDGLGAGLVAELFSVAVAGIVVKLAVAAQLVAATA